MASDDAWRWLGDGGGEAASVIRGVDWPRTAVGAVETWPPELKSILSMMLYARQPMFLWWGPELIQFYNDGYTPSFGLGRHPAAMGQRGKDCWGEIWPVIGPEIEGVIADRKGTFHEDALVPIFRNGRMEEVYWTYGYSPVFDGRGEVAGVLVVVTETTTRVLTLRRQMTARRLVDTLLLAGQSDLAQRAVHALQDAPEDAPWAVAIDSLGGGLLAHTPNLAPAKAAAVAAGIRTADVALTPVPVHVAGLPGGPWPESSTAAVAMPLHARRGEDPQGVLIVGLSPRLPYDRLYEEHIFDLARLVNEAAQSIASRVARAAAERSRDDLLLQAPVAAALLVGPSWRFELANRAYVELVGREVVGSSWHERFPELIGTQVEAILKRVYTDGETIVSNEQLVPLARVSDGVVEERYFNFNIIPIRSRHDEVNAMMVIAVELTAQVRARRDLERTAVEREELVRELRAASRSKDEFVAMLGHELRNPIAPIATALSVLELRQIQGIDRERAVIARQVRHLTRLVDDLLDVARLASDKVALSLAPVDVSQLVTQALELATPLMEERAQHVRVEVAAGCRVRVDESRLTQVLANLLRNASKYSNRGTEIVVRAERRNERVAITVRDNGIGIDADMLPRVFDMFSQERQSLARSGGGLGLGLAIVRNLVVMHGGTVSAESKGRDQGSTFTVELPLCEDAGAEPVTHADGTRPLPSSGETRRVLIVDDNEDAAELLAQILGQLGHVTCVAADGPTAISLVDHFAPDVALLDIGLPVMDGYELAQHLRARADGHRLQMYALTGYGQEGDRARSRTAGFDGHFVKPLDVSTLIRAIGQRPT
ncbi:MAG: ATP-binding protein [Polyangiales bacterium]